MAKGNETTTKFKVDISELKKSMQEARKQVAYANSEFKATASSMDDWSKSSDGISAKLKQLKSNLKSQETVLAEYEKTLEKVKKEYGENSKEALEYATKLNNQQAVVNKTKKEIANYEDALKEVSEAEKIASKTGQDVADVLDDMHKKTEDAGDGFTVLKGAVAEFVGNALTQLVDGLKEGITSLVSFSDEADKAMNSFQASTGATAEEMAGFEDAMKNIYKGNYGESFEDIATAMGEVKRIAGDIGADDLEKMTKDALVLRDTFDFEVSESMRAVNSLMDQFGVSSDEAFNLLAQGAQKGLNQNGDLLDVINEYAVHFSSFGISAEDMFNVLNAGAIEGVFSIDKMGDAMKEFGIRVKDGSDTTVTAFELLGLNADEMQVAFSKGGSEAEDAYWKVWKSLDAIDDEVTRNNIGVKLFGTMWEDLGDTAITEAMGMTDAFNGTIDTMEKINSIKYNSVGEAIQGIGRNLQTGVLMPIGDKLLPIVSDLATKFQEWLNDPATQEGIQTLTDSVTEFVDNGLQAVKDFIVWFLANKDAVIAGLAGIAGGMGAYVAYTTALKVMKDGWMSLNAVQKIVTASQTVMNAVMNANPLMLIVTLIIAVVTALVTFIATNEDARAKIAEIWQKIKEGIGTAIEAIGKFFTETIPEFLNKGVELFLQFIENTVTFFKELPTKIKEFLYQALVAVTATLIALPILAYRHGKEFLEKLISFFKQLPEKVWTWLTNVITKVTTWRADMKAKAQEVALDFINKVVEFVKQLPEKVWTWLTNVITKVTTWKNDLGQKAKEAGQELLDKLIEKVQEIPTKIKSIGSDIVTGLYNGISDKVGWLKEKISGFVGDVTSWLKEFFQIGSPSKLMANEVGKWLPEGIAVGISDNAKSVLGAMKDLTVDTLGGARAGLKTATTTLGGGTVTGGVVNNFYQTINSPKQFSRLDIYRQSKNLLGYAGGGY